MKILIVDNDNLFIEILRFILDEHQILYTDFISFNNNKDAILYLESSFDKSPYVILLETLDCNKCQDFSFLEKYPSLKRNDLVYIISVSFFKDDINKCLSYPFVKKYITKPIFLNHFKQIENEYYSTIENSYFQIFK